MSFEYRLPKGKKHKRHGRADLSKLVYKHLRRHVPVYAIELERLRSQWPKLVPPRIAKRTWPAKLMRKQLWLHVHDNQWLHELGYLRQEILERLHREPHFRNIESIELRLGKIPDAVPEPPPPPRREAIRPLDPEAPPDTQAAVEAVHDPLLRDAIRDARRALGAQKD